jgi:hypothetical protein
MVAAAGVKCTGCAAGRVQQSSQKESLDAGKRNFWHLVNDSTSAVRVMVTAIVVTISVTTCSNDKNMYLSHSGRLTPDFCS